ncbi:MAG: hypothetical protein M0R17_01195 [Candidatus Omnitrophica bacterium]|nr:hypothetical protein [Candidatus Omnitrophota bacterium]
MKNIIEEPIRLVKYMQNNATPYTYYSYPNLKINELPIHTSQELKDYIPKFNKHYRTCYHTNFTTEYVDSNGKNKYLIK